MSVIIATPFGVVAAKKWKIAGNTAKYANVMPV